MKPKGWKFLGALLVLAAVCLCAAQINHNLWLYGQPKFRDLDMELGQPVPEFSQFFTEYADPRLATQETELSQIDVTKTGVHSLTFRHGSKVETVTLTVHDTVAPTAVFHDMNAVAGQELRPEDFVSDVYDLSEVTVSFVEGAAVPASYGNAAVQVAVTDASGNTVTGVCRIFYDWMLDSYTMELGGTVTKGDLLMDPDRDGYLLDQTDLDAVNAAPVGTYTITSTEGEQSCSCVITVQDTTPPELVLKNVYYNVGDRVELEDFVVSATDLSGDVTVTLLTELDFTAEEPQTVQIQAADSSGNTTVAQTTLAVKTDFDPPIFYGMFTMSVAVGSDPDYSVGIYAYDEQDGYIGFTVEPMNVDTSRRGNYYVRYTAVDASGNTVTAYRRVAVSHDESDTNSLVVRASRTLSGDVLQIRDYVRDSIYYNYNDWGGGDPVWSGLQFRQGNCYVFANVLLRLLQEKGYTCQLIWVTDEESPHYWVLLYIDGVWRHIDATPGPAHMVYDLMTDEQRLETLSGRTWDRDNWPAAE